MLQPLVWCLRNADTLCGLDLIGNSLTSDGARALRNLPCFIGWKPACATAHVAGGGKRHLAPPLPRRSTPNVLRSGVPLFVWDPPAHAYMPKRFTNIEYPSMPAFGVWHSFGRCTSVTGHTCKAAGTGNVCQMLTHAPQQSTLREGWHSFRGGARFRTYSAATLRRAGLIARRCRTRSMCPRKS